MALAPWLESQNFDVTGDLHNGGVRVVVTFLNGRGVSIVQAPGSYGFDQGLYECAALDTQGKIDYTTPLGTDVVGWCTEDDILRHLATIQNL